MAINYGPWWYSWPSNGLRLGWEITASEVTNASTDITYTLKLYSQNQYSYGGDAQSINFKDALGDDGDYPDFEFTNSEGSEAVLRTTLTYTYTYTTYGTSPGDLHMVAELNGGAGGIAPYASQTVTIPARPYAPPNPPTSAVLTRNSDTSATLTWTRNSVAGNLYQSQTIAVREWAGATPWTDASWTTVATVSGSATSYTRTTGLQANRAYQFRVRANNSNGSSTWAESGVIFMTPAAPSGVTSALNSTATAITTTWTDNAYTYPATGTWKIQRSVDGGAYADNGTVASKTPTSYTDNSPAAGSTNTYRVAAVVGALQSAYATGNTVAAPATPQPPTLLAPDGVSVDFVHDDVVFTWQHNPGGTGVAQTKFAIEYSDDAGANWDPLTGAEDVTSAVSSFTLAAGTLANGVPYLWRVKTAGVTSAGYGSFSAAAAVTGSSKPTATFILPIDPTNTFSIIASWAYDQVEVLPQTAWTAQLWNAAGTVLLEEQVGYDSGAEATFAYVAETGTTYGVRVRVMSSAGVWSDWIWTTTEYILLPPVLPISSGTFQPCSGTVLLEFAPGTVTPGTDVAIESITVERRAPGEDWVVLAAGLLIPTEFIDTLPVTNGVNEYRITAVSATPSRATAPILEVAGTDGAKGSPLWVWLNYGDHFEHVLRVQGDLSISASTGRAKATQHFLGRPKPVALVGQAVTRAVSVGGTLRYDAVCPVSVPDSCRYDTAPSFWEAAGEDAEVVCYRDYTGRRLFGTLGQSVSVEELAWPGMARVGFDVTVVDFTERYILLVTA